MEERAKRKLSAILSADVKGYSRLMGEDELATVRTLEANLSYTKIHNLEWKEDRMSFARRQE